MTPQNPTEAYSAVISENELQYRDVQAQAVSLICNNFKNKKTLLMENTTGSGKTLIYLIASAFFCQDSHWSPGRKKIVIATPTKTLQYQSLKDAELVQKVFDVKVAILKGKQNYLNRQDIEATLEEALSEEDKTDEEINEDKPTAFFLTKLLEAADAINGDLDRLPESFRKEAEELGMDLDFFTLRQHTSDTEALVYFDAVKETARNADIVITNQHFWGICAHNHTLLAAKNLDRALPFSTDYVIIDEFHLLPKNIQMLASGGVALSSLRWNFRSLARVFQALRSRARSSSTKRTIPASLIDEIGIAEMETEKLIASLQSVISGGKNMIVLKREDEYGIGRKIAKFNRNVLSKIVRRIEKAVQKTDKRRMTTLARINADAIIFDCGQMSSIANAIENLHSGGYENDKVCFIRFSPEMKFPSIWRIPPRIDNYIRNIWKMYIGVVGSSGTMTDIQTFSEASSMQNIIQSQPVFKYIRAQSGINVRDFGTIDSSKLRFSPGINEISLPSAFKKNIAVNIYADLPAYNYKEGNGNSGEEKEMEEVTESVQASQVFVDGIMDTILSIIGSAQRGILILSPAFAEVKIIAEALRAANIPKEVLEHSPAQNLRSCLVQFTQREGNAVIVSPSGWEGIDLPHPLHSDVIITRMPLGSPNDPFYQAKRNFFFQNYQRGGMDQRLSQKKSQAVYQEALNDCSVKFRQGCGRIGRHEQAAGHIHILDSRTVQRKTFKCFLHWCQREYETTIVTAETEEKKRNVGGQ